MQNASSNTHSQSILFTRKAFRVNKAPVHSHELTFAFIRSERAQKSLRPVARSFSKRPPQQPSIPPMQSPVAWCFSKLPPQPPSSPPMQSAGARCFSPRPFRRPALQNQTEQRAFIAGVENLWVAYTVSSQQLETEREATLGQLNGFLSELGYLG